MRFTQKMKERKRTVEEAERSDVYDQLAELALDIERAAAEVVKVAHQIKASRRGYGA